MNSNAHPFSDALKAKMKQALQETALKVTNLEQPDSTAVDGSSFGKLTRQLRELAQQPSHQPTHLSKGGSSAVFEERMQHSLDALFPANGPEPLHAAMQRELPQKEIETTVIESQPMESPRRIRQTLSKAKSTFHVVSVATSPVAPRVPVATRPQKLQEAPRFEVDAPYYSMTELLDFLNDPNDTVGDANNLLEMPFLMASEPHEVSPPVPPMEPVLDAALFDPDELVLAPDDPMPWELEDKGPRKAAVPPSVPTSTPPPPAPTPMVSVPTPPEPKPEPPPAQVPVSEEEILRKEMMAKALAAITQQQSPAQPKPPVHHIQPVQIAAPVPVLPPPLPEPPMPPTVAPPPVAQLPPSPEPLPVVQMVQAPMPEISVQKPVFHTEISQGDKRVLVESQSQQPDEEEGSYADSPELQAFLDKIQRQQELLQAQLQSAGPKTLSKATERGNSPKPDSNATLNRMSSGATFLDGGSEQFEDKQPLDVSPYPKQDRSDTINLGGTMAELSGYKDLSKPPSFREERDEVSSVGNLDRFSPPSELAHESMNMPDTTYTSNVSTLIRLVSELPEGVTKQTGAQIIRLTMEAMGISMEEVLTDAQSAQSEMLDSVRSNIKKIEEYKTVIRKLETDIKFYQGKANELSEIIDLFILSNTTSKVHSLEDLGR